MTTRALLKATILDDMHRTSVADGTRVINEISTAIKFYQPRRFFFNDTRAITFSTVASTDVYPFNTPPSTVGTVGAEFYRIDGVWITISSTDIRELVQVHPDDMEESADEDTTTGEPSEWSYMDRSFRLWRKPDAIYSVRLMGHIKLAEPATDAETGNSWMTEAYELLRARAKYMLALHVWDDPELAARMKIAIGEAEGALISATFDKFRTGFVTATEF